MNLTYTPTMADELNDPLQFEVIAATLRLGMENTSSYLAALARNLERALPGQVDVSEQGIISRKVTAVCANLRDRSYRIDAVGAQLRCTIGSVVRGITLRTDEVDLDDWTAQLSKDLVVMAERSLAARVALEQLANP